MILRDKHYLDYLKTQRCLITGLYGSDMDGVDPMHISTAGKGIKSPDNEALPILHSFHQLGHAHGEMTMLRSSLPDHILRLALQAYARELYQEYLNGKVVAR